jgi:TatD family-associated radical SAM protein
MTITYCVGDGLYVNMTNRCSNRCEFCERELRDSVGDAESLWLDREPSREEILSNMQKRVLTKYSEVVFCGFGEPTERLDDLLWLCAQLKKTVCPPIRVNTNGHASLIAGYDTAPMFAGLVDKLSISLNASGADEYNILCKPVFGLKAYQSLLDFAKRAKEYVPDVVFSVVEGTTDVEACRRVAEQTGLSLKVRQLIV